jgi:RNase H-fold protein (predicted Holliday junction resolvase)
MDGIESSIDLLNTEKIGADMLPLLLTEMNPKVFNSFLFSSYKQLIDHHDAFVEAPVIGKDTYVKGGFVETAAPFSNTTTLPVISKQKVKKQWESLDAILTLLRKRNIKFILVQAPIQKELYQSVHTIKFDAEMKKRGTYYNFNELITMDDSLDFKDEHHLNQRGVEKFNRALLGYFR